MNDNTKQLIDAVIARTYSERNAIAYLLGRLEAAEEKLNEVRVTLGEHTQETFTEILRRAIR